MKVNEDLKRSTIIEGVASTSHRDVQGEVLDLDGADISALLDGRGFANSDHSGRFEHLVGRVIGAKKVMSLGDCETPSQIKYWSEEKRPFLWTKLELWDGHGHKEADSISSIYKFYNDKNEPSPIKLSVEGKTVERGKGGLLKRTVIKGVAITVHPANRATRTDVVGLVKNAGGSQSLIKSDLDLAPIFIEQQDNPLERILTLALTAKDLLKSINKPEKLKCVEALERLRGLKKI